MNNKKLFKIFAACFAIMYLLLFFGRVICEINTPVSMHVNSIMNWSSDYEYSVRNVATAKSSFLLETGDMQITEQKYEKISTINSVTSNYLHEEQRVYQIAEYNNAIIQQQNKSGLEGDRRLQLTIGVKPESFDEIVAQLSELGKVTYTNETKTDKTNEYRQMVVDREKLEKTKESYIALRDLDGGIYEKMSLEQSIIDIDGEILNQSVNLGDYSDENSFCTVNFTLTEGSVTALLPAIANAFVWSLKIYAAIIGLFALIAIGATLVMLLVVAGKFMAKKVM